MWLIIWDWLFRYSKNDMSTINNFSNRKLSAFMTVLPLNDKFRKDLGKHVLQQITLPGRNIKAFGSSSLSCPKNRVADVSSAG